MFGTRLLNCFLIVSTVSFAHRVSAWREAEISYVARGAIFVPGISDQVPRMGLVNVAGF